jgi:hypothetical protein
VADYHCMSQGSDYATRWTVWVSNPSRGKGVLFLQRRPYRPWNPPGLLFSSYRSSFLGIKEINRPGSETDHSTPSIPHLRPRSAQGNFKLFAFLCAYGSEESHERPAEQQLHNAIQKIEGIASAKCWYPHSRQHSVTPRLHGSCPEP